MVLAENVLPFYYYRTNIRALLIKRDEDTVGGGATCQTPISAAMASEPWRTAKDLAGTRWRTRSARSDVAGDHPKPKSQTIDLVIGLVAAELSALDLPVSPLRIARADQINLFKREARVSTDD